MRTTIYTDRKTLRQSPKVSSGRPRHVTDQYRAHIQTAKRALQPMPPRACCSPPSKSTSTGGISARLIFSPPVLRHQTG
ncbi:MAG TPA: hypothetical protein VIC05_12145 [Solirubrobacteraceae bacterium]